MEFLVSVMPGVSFACVIFMLAISSSQFYIYRREGYRRSRAIALFSFFAALFAIEHVIVQSRLLPPVVLYYYMMISTPALFASYFYYIESLNFFIAFPNWFYKSYKCIAGGLFFLTLIPLPADLFFHIHVIFNPHDLSSSGNYFVDSYTSFIGAPQPFANITLSIGAVLTVLTSIYILRKVLRTSRDAYFIIGLALSISSSILENFLLPFTYTFFVPVIFLSNLFEAFRMNTLANQEYVSQLEHRERKEEESPEVEKYQNSNLTDERIEELADKINEVFNRDKLFLNPNLHLEDVARRIGIPNYQLSQVINTGMDTNFFELLSEFRINFVKEKLQEKPDETIISIAYEAGFNSKSAFNTAFKKQTGMTPSVYRRQIGAQS